MVRCIAPRFITRNFSFPREKVAVPKSSNSSVFINFLRIVGKMAIGYYRTDHQAMDRGFRNCKFDEGI